MGNYTFENLNSFFHHTNKIILNELKVLQSKTTNAESILANSLTIVTV